MRKIIFLSLLIFSVSALAKELITVGIVTDGSSSYNEKIISLINKEVQRLTKNEFDVSLNKKYYLQGKWKKEGIQAALEKLYNTPEVDIVLVLGYAAPVVAVNQESYPKPTVASIIIDERIANAPLAEGTSGEHNLTYISIRGNMERELKFFREVVDFKRVVLITDALISEVLPKLSTKGKREALDMKIKLMSIQHNGGSVDELLSRFPKNTEAVMIGALPRINHKDKKRLLKKLTDRGLPSYSMVNSALVEQGALVTTLPSDNSRQIARRIALNIQGIILGEDPKDMSIFINEKRRLLINMKTARKLRVSPPFEVMIEAEKVHDISKKHAVHWNLKKVAKSAVGNNLSLKASRLNLKIGKEQVTERNSALLPQLSMGASHRFRGGDNANTLGKRAGTLSANLSQIIYDESTQSALDIENIQQKVRRFQNRQTQLDVIQNATIKFLSVLKAQTLRDIQKENVLLSRANLELAYSKARIGTSSKADVYRWESSMMTAKSNYLTAHSSLQQEKEALNHILNRPLTEKFDVDAALVNDPILVMNDPRLAGMIGNKSNFNKLSKILIKQGLKASPDIAIARENIAIEKRQLRSEERGHYIPTATIVGEYSNTYDDSRDALLSQEGKNDWYAGVQLSLPLYEGGARTSRENQSKLKLQQLQWNLDETQDSIEQNIRANLHITQASKMGIELQEAAAESSKKNYDLVYDAYTKGTASVVDMVDAQSSALTAKYNAVNATYEFLINMMYLQRSIGNFDFFLSDEKRSAMVREIKKKTISRR